MSDVVAYHVHGLQCREACACAHAHASLHCKLRTWYAATSLI